MNHDVDLAGSGISQEFLMCLELNEVLQLPLQSLA
jgi:hypothetical protein